MIGPAEVLVESAAQTETASVINHKSSFTVHSLAFTHFSREFFSTRSSSIILRRVTSSLGLSEAITALILYPICIWLQVYVADILSSLGLQQMNMKMRSVGSQQTLTSDHSKVQIFFFLSNIFSAKGGSFYRPTLPSLVSVLGLAVMVWMATIHSLI